MEVPEQTRPTLRVVGLKKAEDEWKLPEQTELTSKFALALSGSG